MRRFLHGWVVLWALFPVCLHAQELRFGAGYHSGRPADLLGEGRGLGLGTGFTLGYESRWVRIRLEPEWRLLTNASLDRFPVESLPSALRTYYIRDFGYVDLPEQYGSGPRTVFFPGDSRLALRAGPVSVGLSTESRAWGAGERQQLLLARSAPGFPHAFFELDRVPVGIGRFSLDLLVGRPDSSGFSRYPIAPNRVWFTGLRIAWEPDLLPGLELGAIRNTMVNDRDLETRADLIPFLSHIKRIMAEGDYASVVALPDNSLASVWFRWRLPESGFTAYGEFGREDHNADWRDALLHVEHNRAYLWGLFRRGGSGALGFEIVHLPMSNTRFLRSSATWYQHTRVRHGYTHRGRILGAEAGQGGSSRELWGERGPWSAAARWTHRQQDLFRFGGFAAAGYAPEHDLDLRLGRTWARGPWTLDATFGWRHTWNRHFRPGRSDRDLYLATALRYSLGGP